MNLIKGAVDKRRYILLAFVLVLSVWFMFLIVFIWDG